MIKVAILDDYQNVSQEFVDLKKLSGKYEIKVFIWLHFHGSRYCLSLKLVQC
jgi:hypothetical protein